MRCGTGAVRTLSQRPSSSRVHLWISDELLESAFNRFVRSQPGQRRSYHGHTSGPLEFRRRQAHRRMASMTFYDPSQHSLPSLWPTLSNLTSLFRPRPAPDTQWTWEAPGQPVVPAQTTLSLPYLKDFDQLPRQKYDEALSDKCSVADIRALYWELCPIGEDAVAFSQASCRRIHHLMEPRISTAPADALQSLFDFLDSDMNVPEAGNLLASLTWSMANSPSVLSASRVLDHLSECVDNGKVSTNELQSLMELYQQKLKVTPFSKRGLSRLDTLCDSVESWLLRHEGTRAQLSVTDAFVGFLDSLPRRRVSSALLIRVVAKLPVAVRCDYNQTIQSHLLHCLRLGFDSGGKYRLNGMLQQSFGFQESENDLSKAWCLEILSDITNNLIHSSRTSTAVVEYWISTLKCTYDQKLDFNQDLWKRLATLFSQSRGRVGGLLHRPGLTSLMSDRPLAVNRPISRSNIAKATTAQIHDFVSRGDINRARRVFLSCSMVSPSSCKELVFDMVSSGRLSVRAYLGLLSREDQQSTMIMSDDQDTRANLAEDRIRQVEDLAYHISVSAAPSHRQAFRMVHILYRYLTDNAITPGPGISRALLRTGVNRLLRNGVMVPRERYLWILHIVEQAEGREIADQLDQVARRWIESVQTQMDDHEARRIKA